MQLQTFNVKFSHAWLDIDELIGDESVKVRFIQIVPNKDMGDRIYIFYDWETTVKDEQARIAELRNVAKRIAKNEVFQRLSNVKQKTIFLVEQEGISKKDAEDVIEIVKIIEVEEAEKRKSETLEALAKQERKVKEIKEKAVKKKK